MRLNWLNEKPDRGIKHIVYIDAAFFSVAVAFFSRAFHKNLMHKHKIYYARIITFHYEITHRSRDFNRLKGVSANHLWFDMGSGDDFTPC